MMSFSACSSAGRALERMSTAIVASPAMVFTEVPPPTLPTVKVVLGSAGTCTSPMCAIARPIAWIALGTCPKAAKLWPPGPLKATS